MHGEYALDTLTVGDLPDRETLTNGPIPFCQHDPGKNLDPLFAAFNNPGVHLDLITRVKRGDRVFHLLVLDLLDDVHGTLVAKIQEAAWRGRAICIRQEVTEINGYFTAD